MAKGSKSWYTKSSLLLSNLAIPVFAGLGTGIALVMIFAIFFTPFSSQADRNSVCGESIEIVKDKVKANESFAFLLPTKLPKGYSLQTLDYVPNAQVIMQYFTRSLCNPNFPYSPDEGVVEIVEGSLSHATDAKSGEEYVQVEMAKYRASNINATSYAFQDGRMHAIGFWDETCLKAHLWVVDDKTRTIVKIEARSIHTSLQQLATIGESLKE
jgi:hypothetical protein